MCSPARTTINNWTAVLLDPEFTERDRVYRVFALTRPLPEELACPSASDRSSNSASPGRRWWAGPGKSRAAASRN